MKCRFPWETLLLCLTANQPPTTTLSTKMRMPTMENNGSRIVGGMTTDIQKVPYQVALLYRDYHICGGVIISSRWVLTAAHCVKLNIYYLHVRAGSSYSESGGSIHRIKRRYIHEDFHSTKSQIPVNDIALLLIRDAFLIDNTRRPVKIFSGKDQIESGSYGWISGWGRTSYGGPTSKVLQMVKVPIVSRVQCARIYHHLGKLPPGQFCAGYETGGRDSCSGDSGGPLVIDGKLAGIVSWGVACGLDQYPGVYTEVPAYYDWIMRHVKRYV